MAVFAFFAAAAGVSAFSYHGASGDILSSAGRVSVSQLPVSMDFEVPTDVNLITVSVTSDVRSGWAYFDLELESEEDDIVQIGGQRCHIKLVAA